MLKKCFTFPTQRGVTLIEVLLAVVLIGILSAALIQLGITALKGANAGKMRSVAVELTKQGLEAARAKRDENSSAFFAQSDGFYRYTGSAFEPISGTEPVMPADKDPYAVTGFTNYYRVIHFETTATDTITVTVKTYWQEGGSYNSVDMATVLTKWR
ncbi:MAG: prepilin-type N-terminal cleavage/methylation domain-containing protein [Candidatus Cloacimonetes bacterium]|nr:prepilin-type N-terminal cleavage/methylation domain-containing protein [Candidatus Cloacimonadota bacterium]